jgi:hypothetical protein
VLNRGRSQGFRNIFNRRNRRRTLYGLFLTIAQGISGVGIVAMHFYFFVEKASTFDGEVNNTLRTVYSMIYGILFVVFQLPEAIP